MVRRKRRHAKKDESRPEEQALTFERLEADHNTWHILDEQRTSRGIVNTYVDDILAISEKAIVEATMEAIDKVWKCAETEHLGEEAVKFCGMTLLRVKEGVCLEQTTYANEVLKRNGLDESNPTRTILDKDECLVSDDQRRIQEEKPFDAAVRDAQKLAG